MLLMLVIFAVMMIPMFLMSSRQRKAQREAQEMRSKLGVGDEVATIGGFVGLIVEESPDFVVLESENGAHLKFRRQAIAGLADPTAAATASDDEQAEADAAADEAVAPVDAQHVETARVAETDQPTDRAMDRGEVPGVTSRADDSHR